jgi:hypothetical protein
MLALTRVTANARTQRSGKPPGKVLLIVLVGRAPRPGNRQHPEIRSSRYAFERREL